MAIKETIKGTAHEVKGKIKEEAGKLVNDPGMVAKGQGDQYKGAAIKGYGETKDQVKEKLIEGLDKVKRTVKGLKDDENTDVDPADRH